MRVHLQALFACTFLLAAMTAFTPNAAASGPINVAYALSGNPTFPVGSLVADSAGNLYGTTLLTAGGSGCGIVFKLTPQAGGGWQFAVIHTFIGSDGCEPAGGLIIDAAGISTAQPLCVEHTAGERYLCCSQRRPVGPREFSTISYPSRPVTFLLHPAH